jgi:hypothetical protein
LPEGFQISSVIPNIKGCSENARAAARIGIWQCRFKSDVHKDVPRIALTFLSIKKTDYSCSQRVVCVGSGISLLNVQRRTSNSHILGFLRQSLASLALWVNAYFGNILFDEQRN